MRIAFYTYSYTDRLKLPIRRCLVRVARTGYCGIDVSGTHGGSDDPRSFDAARRRLTRSTAKSLGLSIEAVITHAPLADTLADPKRRPLDLKRSIDLAVDLGADVVTFHMGGQSQGITAEKLWNRVVEHIKIAADYGAARHVALAVDGIWPIWLDNSPDALQRLFDDVGHLTFGVNFDPSYLTLMGVDPEKFAHRFRKRIVHAHLKDHRGTYPKWKHLMPGHGQMNYTKVFRALKNIGFAKAAAVECFTNMKFQQACDGCFLAMTKAAHKANVKFQKCA